MGAPATAPWKALINSPRQSKPRHANEGRGDGLSVRLGRPLMCLHCNSRCAGCTVSDRSARLIHPHRVVKRWIH